jgi:hypothetical protein
MKHLSLLQGAAVAAALLFAVGCQPTAHIRVAESPTAQFDRYQSIAVDVSPQPPSGYSTWSDAAEARADVRDAASQILAELGYDLTTPDKADLIVRIEEGRRNEQVPGQTFEPASNSVGGAAEFQGQITTTSEEQTRGSFVIQALDARTHRVVWQGSAEARVTPGKIDHARLRGVVESVLRTFPQPPTPAK